MFSLPNHGFQLHTRSEADRSERVDTLQSVFTTPRPKGREVEYHVFRTPVARELISQSSHLNIDFTPGSWWEAPEIPHMND